MLLLTALSNASFSKEPFHGSKGGSHHHHHHGGKHAESSDDRNGGGVQSDNSMATSIEDEIETAGSVNASGGVLDLNGTDIAGAFDATVITEIPGQEEINEVNELLNTTEHWFASLLANVSAYIPVNIEYAANVGNFCDPITYNAPYYNVPSLIISGVLFFLGILFTFFGQWRL